MKKMKFTLLAIAVFFTATTFGQNAVATQGLSLSIGPEGAIPIGSFKSQSGYKFGLGGSAKLGIPLTSNLDATISAGYIAFSRSKLDQVRNENTFTTIPFKAGLRVRANQGFYFEPQVGFTQTKISNQEGAGVFTYAANVGYLISKAVDIAVRYEALASRKGQVITGATREDVSAKMIGIRLAYNFNFARESK